LRSIIAIFFHSTTMPLVDGKGQWQIYYFASRCKAAWGAFENQKADWRNDLEQHQWWTKGLQLEGVSFFDICTSKRYHLILKSRTDSQRRLVITLLQAL
jgi:hypothetical protein